MNDQSVDFACVHNMHMNSNPKTPKMFKEVIKMDEPEKLKWIEAVRKEIMYFMKRKSWIKTPKAKVALEGRRPLKVKHMFKIKDKPTGVRYKD